MLHPLQNDMIEALLPVFARGRVLGMSDLKLRGFAVAAVVEYFRFGTTTKMCTKCGVLQDRDGFGRDSSKRDGLFAWCRQCRKS